MKTTFTVFIAIFFSLNGSSQTSSVQRVLDSYLKVKEALVKSDATQAATFSTELIKAITTAEISSLKPNEKKMFEKERETMLKSAQKVASTGDIEKQRSAFADLSSAMWRVMKGAESITGNVYYQYCPMKKTYWMSAEPVIRNPYYGSKMLSCGSVSEKK